ncbi:MAG: hypothetical protein JWM32_1778 [Verrucomicrobia bacterium]|nr:hypothetical protein [Verrucomicrobiota bacterium]
MLFLAVAPTTLEKIKHVPPEFWWKVGIAVLVLVVVVIILQKVAGANKVVMAVIALIVFSVVGINWIYERNEPKFLTPLVDKIAPFLPSKGSYGAKQATNPVLPPPPPAPPKKG